MGGYRRIDDCRISEERPMESSLESIVVPKVTWRLIPLLFLCYIIAYIDRINVAFAGLQLQKTFGVDTAAYYQIYGWGAGLFFLGYFLFEVPSNLILHRVGARLWIARIMIVWGLISSATMFIKTPAGFYAMRFLLGVAEAGFFPGIILYLTYWFRARDRARTVALFSTAGTLAGFFNSPISGKLLQLDGVLGWAGWQWLFLIEGIPAVIVGLVVLVVLPDKPQKARWLSDTEREWIRQELARDEAQAGPGQQHRLRDVFASGRVWLLCAIYFLLNVGAYGFEMWLPQIIRGFSGLGEFGIGLLNAIPYLAATICMVLVGRHSDRTGERRWHVAASAFAAAAGFAASALSHNLYVSLAALALAFSGVKSMLGPFWAQSTVFLSGTAAAGGIAWINSVGNLGGFVGPTVVGQVRKATGSYANGLFTLGAALVLLGFLALTLRAGRDSRGADRPAPAVAPRLPDPPAS
jgi:ACS family tartrate transporter-like MFS transporter